jgi:hypothetical protein
MPISSGPYAILTQMQSYHVDALSYSVSGIKVVGEQQPYIADPSGGSVVDSQGRTVLNNILDLLEEHGLMASA